MKSNNFQPGDSLKTIEAAIQQTKSESTGARFYYILWGLMLMLHFALRYVTSHYPNLSGSLTTTLIYLVFPIGGLLSYLRSKKDDKKETIKLHYEKVYVFGFGGFAIAYGIIFLATVISNRELPIILFPLLLGLTVFFTGGMTRFRPSIICGIIGIICTGISVNATIETQYALAAMASLITLVIPGYLMKLAHV